MSSIKIKKFVNIKGILDKFGPVSYYIYIWKKKRKLFHFSSYSRCGKKQQVNKYSQGRWSFMAKPTCWLLAWEKHPIPLSQSSKSLLEYCLEMIDWYSLGTWIKLIVLLYLLSLSSQTVWYKKLRRRVFFAKGKMPNPRACQVSWSTIQTNAQTHISKQFFCIFDIKYLSF